MIGGIGPCGLTLCCATFLSDFAPISMKMAKDQSLFLNPVKFSGVCGKLMCCLRYEHEPEGESKPRLPQIGEIVMSSSGQGKVLDLNLKTNIALVQLLDGKANWNSRLPNCASKKRKSATTVEGAAWINCRRMPKKP